MQNIKTTISIADMHKQENNYAFIDTQNIYLAIKEQGWLIDWKKFRIYLREKYKVEKAFLFIGYLESNKKFYKFLRQTGYKIIFKEILKIPGEIKGNVDAELVLQTMIEFENYDKAIIVTNDGDFTCLIKHLRKAKKLIAVISTSNKKCSALLRKAAKEKLLLISKLKSKFEYNN